MQPVVIPSKLEQEYLLRALEAGVRVRTSRQLFLWAQGELQALLPHQALVCLRLDAGGAVRRLECLHGALLAPEALVALYDPVHGLAAQAARRWREGGRAPLALDTGAHGECGQWLRASGFDNLLVHGSAVAGADASAFALFGLPMRPGARHAYFLELLLPCLHLALAGLPAAPGPGMAPPRALSRREAQVVQWLREGKSNAQIGALLGISALTVKNHLQRIYKVLGVANRAHALARCLELRLLDGLAN